SAILQEPIMIVRRKHVPVIYYTNVLISNLIQLIMLATLVAKWNSHEVIIICIIISFFGVMASLYFKMCIALERYFFIAYPLWDCRQTKGSVLVCVVVWVLCIVSVPLAIVLQETLRLFIYGLLPAPLFIFCLAGTLKALPAATSVPREEKQRVVGTLVLLLLNYFLMILPTIICVMSSCHYMEIISILFLLNPFVDLFLVETWFFDLLPLFMCFEYDGCLMH
uniref:G-protein coupled receptors family 1 profile domain-containing protein n=1 Tax=Amphilophus citrinellus TaxID=61819 RepID=A0A3Q0T8I3_AMPCI